jgi:acetyl-CoA acetyltransferase
MSRSVCLVGAAIAVPEELPHAPTSHSIAAQAARRAIADAGVGKDEIDGLFTNSDSIDMEAPIVLSQYLGIKPRFADGTELGGASWESYIHHAVAAIEHGHCDVALVTYGRAARTEGASEHWEAYGKLYNRVGPGQFEDIYGPTIPSYYAMAAARHMHEYGTTAEQLAEIAVAMRANAASNPLARYRDPITVEEVLASPLIADPLHRLDCCLITDGGGAFILTTEDRAKSLRHKPIHVLGSSEIVLGWNPAYYDDITDVPAFHTGKVALQKAGIRPREIDVAQVYDSFTITVLLSLEGLGFCGKGEGGAFVEGGRLKADGDLPTNTDGGGLSATHPGMRGMFLIIEAARQLWGEATAQVPDAKICLCHGTGGYLSSGSTIVLGT